MYPIETIKKLKDDLAEMTLLAEGRLTLLNNQEARHTAELNEARTLARDWREKWSSKILLTFPPEKDYPFPWEITEREELIARCEKRAIEIYYAAPPDKLAGDCHAELVTEFGKDCVAEMLRNGIGENQRPTSYVRASDIGVSPQ